MRNLLKILFSVGAAGALALCFQTPIQAKTTTIKAFPPGIKFSRVFFFGDSLSDVGNNQDGDMDQAPDTNKSQAGEGYEPGEIWVDPFLRDLKAAGMLDDNATLEVVPSKTFDDDQIPTTPSSIDFAYSGDPSNGYPSTSTGYMIQYHPLNAINEGCINTTTGSNANALCGVNNRVREFTQRGMVDPNALYIIWVGANDIQQELGPDMLTNIQNPNITIDPANPPGQAKAQQVVLNSIHSIDKSIINLSLRGAKYFVVINLPNLGYTPEGYFLNQLYYEVRDPHGPKPAEGTVITQVFTNLTAQYNNVLKNGYQGAAPGLGQLAASLGVTIVQPDISHLFDLARDYKLPDFPEGGKEVNTKAVMSYMSLCCYNYYDDPTDPQHQFEKQYKYEPSHCEISTNVQMLPWVPECPGFWGESKDYGFSPKIYGVDEHDKPKGHFLFFNDIHPTTCTSRYIAQFVTASVKGETYIPPTQPICDA